MPAHSTLKWKKSLYKNEYSIWSNMKQRCYNKNDKMYKYYGARGITISPEWLKSFDTFMDDMGPRPTKRHSIDRINNDGNYEASNCRWTTYTEQNRNQGLTKRNTSGYKGVSRFERDNCWQANIQVNYKSINLGLFKTLEEAVTARKQAEAKYWNTNEKAVR